MCQFWWVAFLLGGYVSNLGDAFNTQCKIEICKYVKGKYEMQFPDNLLTLRCLVDLLLCLTSTATLSPVLLYIRIS